MFTLTVIVFDVIALVWVGLKIYKKSKLNYPVGKYLALGLLMSAFGIFMYGIRSIVLQFEPFETMLKMDEIVYKIGTFVHISGCVLLVWFVYKEFAPRLFTKITAKPVLALLGFIAIAFGFFPLKTVVHQAPLEPTRFMMTSHPWEWPWVSSIFMYGFFIGSAIILGIFLYNALVTENKKKALIFGILTPVLIHFGIAGVSKPGTFPFSTQINWWIAILGLILLITTVFIAENRKRMVKAIMYGLGMSLLLSSAIACVFISPIFARIGYGIGAILVLKSFGMKIE